MPDLESPFDLDEAPVLTAGVTPPPGPLVPNKLVEFIGGDFDFKYPMCGIVLRFKPNPHYGGRRVLKINRSDMYYHLGKYMGGDKPMFRVAQDLERQARARAMQEAIEEAGPEIVQALVKEAGPELADALAPFLLPLFASRDTAKDAPPKRPVGRPRKDAEG